MELLVQHGWDENQERPEQKQSHGQAQGGEDEGPRRWAEVR